MLRSKFNKFNRGEVDEKAMARDDVDRITNSSSLMENFVPVRLGPMQYRPGSEYLDDAFTNVEHYMIPFLSQGDESAIMEFSAADDATGTNTLRIWIDDALMAMTATADTITNPSFATDIASWTDDSDAGGAIAWGGAGVETLDVNGNGSGDWGRAYQTNLLTAGERTIEVWVAEAPIYFAIGTGGVQSDDIFGGWLNPGYHALTFTATAVNHTFTFQNDKAYIGRVQSIDYHAGGTWSVEGPFFYDDSTTGAVLSTVRYAQSADSMYLATNGYEMTGAAWPYILFKRRGTKSWTFELPENIDGPFGPINDSSITLTPSVTGGNGTLTASVGMFKADAFGDSYELIHGATVGRCKVTAYVSSTVVNIRVTADFGGTSATADWYKGLFGYGLPGPTAVEMFEGRMWLTGAGYIHGSVSDLYTSFDARLEGAEAAILKTIGFGTVQDISWILGGEQLLLGLSSEEITLNSNDFGDVITSTNARIRRATSHGSAVMKPVVFNKVIYFAQRALKKIIAITGLSKENVGTEDITLLAPEILDPGVKRMILVGEPEPRIWVLLTDGELRVFLFDKAEDIRGWSRVTIGGSGTIVDIVATPTNEQDAVYIIVDRSGDRTVEKFANFEDAIGQSDSRHYDSHIVYTSPGTTITGLDHLEGVTVNVWGDGIDRQTAVVSGGSITVTTAWTDVVVGVRHTAKYLSNRLGKYLNSSVLTDEKRVMRMGLIMQAVALRTIKYGPSESILQNMPEIEEGRLRAPTEEPEAQLRDTIQDAGHTCYSIELQDVYAFCMSDTVPSAIEQYRDQRTVYYNGSLYVVGGVVSGSVGGDDIYRYNISAGSFEKLTNAPGVMFQHAICELDGVIYVAHSGGANSFMAYDIASDTWLTVAQPTIFYNDCAIAGYDGKLYVYGGNSAGAGTNNWEIYDVVGDSWSTTAYVGSPETKHKHCMIAPQAGTGAGILYMGNGRTGGTTETQAWYKYTISTNTWAAIASSGWAGGDGKVDADDNGYLYFFGGAPRVGSTYHSALRRFDIGGGTWSALDTPVGGVGSSEPWVRMQFGMAMDTDEGDLYILGGYNGNSGPVAQFPPSGYIDDMWHWDISESAWVEDQESLVTAGGALRVVGIEDITDLQDSASLDMESADQSLKGHSSMIDGDYLYAVVEDEDGTNRGIAIADISNPLSPTQVGYLEGGTNTTTIGRAIWKDGNHLYVPSFATNGSLASIDVSDPTTPVLDDELALAESTNPVNTEKMVMVWPRLYIPWEEHIHIVDVSVPGTLTLESKFALNAGALNSQCTLETDVIMWVIDDTGILTGYNLEDPSTPELIGSLVDATYLSNVTDFGIVQPYLYAMQADGGNVFDLTDPSAPTHFVKYTGYSNVKSFATDGGNVLFASSIDVGGVFYAADQRANRYVDYDERPMEFDGTFDTDSRVYLQAQGPATVLAITYDVEDSDNEADDYTGPRNN